MAGLPLLADLSINGMPLNLPAGADTIPKDYRDRFMLQVGRVGDVLTFDGHPSGPITLKLGQELGRGSFGTVYKTDSVIDPKVPLIVKVLDFAPVITKHHPEPPDTFGPDDRIRVIDNFKYDTLIEALSQIVVYETTKTVRFDEINGPFAAKFYLLGVDTKSLYIVSEALDNTVLNLLFPKVPAPRVGRLPAKGPIFKRVILQMSKIFDYLYDNLQFLHRDAKPHNIMYKMIDGQIQVRLIDFGLSCMNYHGVKIQTDDTFPGIMHCNSRIRDMYTSIWDIMNWLRGRGVGDCDFMDILNIVLARGSNVSRDREKIWRNSNLDEPNAIANSDARVVYNIFNSLNFTTDDVSSPITGPWHRSLVLLVSNYADKLSIEQLVEIHPRIIIDNTTSGFSQPSPFAKILRCGDNTIDFTQQFKTPEIEELTRIRNKAGQTPLMLACALNNEALVNGILGIPGIRLAVQDNAGNTCLHFACRKASALMDHKADWEKAVRIIETLLRRNPILSEKRNFANQGPGNPAVSTDPRIRDYVKSVKTYIWQFWKRNPDTNLARGGSRGSSGHSRGISGHSRGSSGHSRGSSGHSRGSRRTRRLGRRSGGQTYKH